MKNSCKQQRAPGSAGFTLIELMMAMFVFLIIGGAAVALINKHVPTYATEQNQASLNVGVRNAVAQMQTDVVNAGSGFYPGGNMPFFPVGITIVNAGNAGCFDPATFNYTGCFDKLNVITADDTIPPAHPSCDAGGNAPLDTFAGCLPLTPPGTMYLTFGITPPPTAAQLSTWANSVYLKNTELLLIQGGTDFSNSNPRMTVVVLSSDHGTVIGNSIQVTFTPTDKVGNPPLDGMNIINPGDSDQLTNIFDPTQDYAIHLAAITYGIDASDPSNPKLVRVPYGTALQGAQNVIAEQIIGFKVGAWNTWSGNYVYDSTAPKGANGYGGDWTSIKAVRIDLTARTPVNSDPSAMSFRNKLDNGPYQVQKISVVINPRNLSM